MLIRYLHLVRQAEARTGSGRMPGYNNSGDEHEAGRANRVGTAKDSTQVTFDEFLKVLNANRPGQAFDVRLTAAELLDLAERQFGGEVAGLVEDLALTLNPGEVVVGG